MNGCTSAARRGCRSCWAASIRRGGTPEVNASSTDAKSADSPTAPPADLSHTPSGWYTPVAHYYFSARFGVPGGWSSGHHTGLDFVTKQGSPIRAATDGVVVAADWAGAYGQLLQIKIGPKMQIWMAHPISSRSARATS